jgi:hypothetical protein
MRIRQTSYKIQERKIIRKRFTKQCLQKQHVFLSVRRTLIPQNCVLQVNGNHTEYFTSTSGADKMALLFLSTDRKGTVNITHHSTWCERRENGGSKDKAGTDRP